MANKTGWQEKDCADCQETICEKGLNKIDFILFLEKILKNKLFSTDCFSFHLDADLGSRSCQAFCMNGGNCSHSNSSLSCQCDEGFTGTRCQINSKYFFFIL